MSFSRALISRLAERHLLKHPFYKDWSEGKLTLDDLRVYARQYFHHVAAFPRYLSATHSRCEDLSKRQILLENLVDEEQGERNHPELWLRFAEAVGCTREEVRDARLFPETKALVNTFFRLSSSSFEEGVGALFAYEQQVPEVAKSKIEGLDRCYGIRDERALDFFTTHLKADEWHTEQTASLLDSMTDEERARAGRAAVEVSNALWGFLDGVQRNRMNAA